MTSRFALLIHDLPELHLDLMLGREEVLWTWRLKRWPDPTVWGTVERILDHRTAYLDLEGPISNDRGTVRRVLQGTVDWLEEDETKAIRLKAHYAGKSAVWELRLRTTEGTSEAGNLPIWQFRRMA